MLLNDTLSSVYIYWNGDWNIVTNWNLYKPYDDSLSINHDMTFGSPDHVFGTLWFHNVTFGTVLPIGNILWSCVFTTQSNWRTRLTPFNNHECLHRSTFFFFFFFWRVGNFFLIPIQLGIPYTLLEKNCYTPEWGTFFGDYSYFICLWGLKADWLTCQDLWFFRVLYALFCLMCILIKWRWHLSILEQLAAWAYINVIGC